MKVTKAKALNTICAARLPRAHEPEFDRSGPGILSVKTSQNAIQETEKPLVKQRSVKQAEALFNSRIFLPEELLKSY